MVLQRRVTKGDSDENVGRICGLKQRINVAALPPFIRWCKLPQLQQTMNSKNKTIDKILTLTFYY